MPSKLKQVKIGLCLLLLSAGSAQAAELSTLFTTPEERQIINSNRYKSDQVKPRQAATVEETYEAPAQLLIRQEVTLEYKISGITISSDGPHTVWINSTAYEDGEQLEDKSKIKVMVGDEIKVRITAPDGKNYYATSGEMLEVSYLAPIQN
jgi:hypothetical protein